MNERVLIMVGVVAYGKAVGLTKDETSALYSRLLSKEVPRNVGEMWQQFDDCVQSIRASRQHTEE